MKYLISIILLLSFFLVFDFHCSKFGNGQVFDSKELMNGLLLENSYDVIVSDSNFPEKKIVIGPGVTIKTINGKEFVVFSLIDYQVKNDTLVVGVELDNGQYVNVVCYENLNKLEREIRFYNAFDSKLERVNVRKLPKLISYWRLLSKLIILLVIVLIVLLIRGLWSKKIPPPKRQ